MSGRSPPSLLTSIASSGCSESTLSFKNSLEGHTELFGSCYPPVAFVKGKEHRLKLAKEAGAWGELQEGTRPRASRCPVRARRTIILPGVMCDVCTEHCPPGSSLEPWGPESFLGLHYAERVEGQSRHQGSRAPTLEHAVVAHSPHPKSCCYYPGGPRPGGQQRHSYQD